MELQLENICRYFFRDVSRAWRSPESEYLADDVNVQMDLYGPQSVHCAYVYPSPRKIGEDKALNQTMVAYLESRVSG